MSKEVGLARYAVTVRTPMSQPEAFAYMADVTNFAAWDPGVSRAVLVRGGAPAPDAAYDLDVRAGPRTITMRYETVAWEEPHRLVLLAETSTIRSLDEIRVEPAAGGAAVTYDAELTLRGPLRMLDPLLGLAFRRVGDRAAAGLRRALGGV